MSERILMAVHAGHNASAAIMRDGVIAVAAQEERFSRKKNYVGYPKQAIDFCLRSAGVTGKDLGRVAFTTTSYQGLLIKAKTSTQFTLRDYIDYFGERYYGRKMRGEDCNDYLRWLNSDPKFNSDTQYYDFSYLSDQVLTDPAKDVDLFRREQRRLLGSHLGFDSTKVEFLDHHTCHAYYAYFGSPFRGKDCIAVTLDGWGDGRNQTVWRVHGDCLNLVADSQQNDIGRIYKLATLILAMRPDEHEFKVMGMAPYSKAAYAARTMKVIENLLQVEGMRIIHKERPKDLYAYLRESWLDHRFDNIAGAVQTYTEQIARQLFRNIARTTGIARFVLSGGISMNVKMNKVIGELEEVEELYVCGSGGDETLSIGGCYFLNRDTGNNAPLRDLYLGSDVGDEMAGFDAEALRARFEVDTQVELSRVAALIHRGDIVAAIRGRAEFGARALGNRSILADPSKRESVQKINEAIKNRDFWMPFAVSILDEQQHQYLVNPKRFSSPFMAISLDTRPERYADIVAGTHPYDYTARPQFVCKDSAPAYHRLISEFQRQSGIPALLNTSFNLHGEPIVDSIADAVRTFELSGLDHLLINDTILLSKRTA